MADYEINELVAVPWGLDVLQGTVVGAYGEGRGRRILVEVEVGDGDKETLPFPPSALEAATLPGETRKSPGAWLSAAQYEQQLMEAVLVTAQSLISEWHDAISGWHDAPAPRIKSGDVGVDFTLDIFRGEMAIEAKYNQHSRVRVDAVDQVARYVDYRRIQHGVNIVGLVVVSAKGAPSVLSRAEQYRKNGVPVWFVHWQPGENEEELHRVVTQALRYLESQTFSE
ncbi:hypothetical protein [Streptomyces sp. NPDC050355]|uniref:hypothetical protein n=1 Tax=Streptomyces sp. NPDC050355 TaxID=3365609 RepID=UPI0037BAD4F7